MSADDNKVKAKLDEICDYIHVRETPGEALVRMAKMGVVLDDWIAFNEVDATAIQCWTSIQQNYGINACTLMSMYSDKLVPSGCEVDITGVISMYALQLASGKPSALVDWNNNYAMEGGQVRAVPLRQLGQELLCGEAGDELWRNPGDRARPGQHLRHGLGRAAAPSPLTFARITTDDRNGKIKTYVGEGRITDDPLDTFGSRAVVEIQDLQRLLRYVCKQRLRAPRGHEPVALGRRAGRGVRDLPGLGRLPALVIRA